MLVQDFLEQSAARLPGKVALVCDQQRLTYTQLENMANRMANAMLENGLCRGDRVAIYLNNSLESVVGIFATLKAGGVFAPVNPTTKRKKLVHYGIHGVTEAAVVGIPDPIFGEVPKAYLVVDGAQFNEGQVLEHCRAHLEDFMVPKYVEFRDVLPKTASGKINKTDLK